MGEVAHSGEGSGPADRQRRLGVAQEILELGQRIGGVQRQERRARRRHASASTITSVDLSTCAATRSPGLTPRPTSAFAARPERSNECGVGQGRGVRRFERHLVGVSGARDDEVEQVCGNVRHGHPRCSASGLPSRDRHPGNLPQLAAEAVLARVVERASRASSGARDAGAPVMREGALRLVKPAPARVSRLERRTRRRMATTEKALREVDRRGGGADRRSRIRRRVERRRFGARCRSRSSSPRAGPPGAAFARPCWR